MSSSKQKRKTLVVALVAAAAAVPHAQACGPDLMPMALLEGYAASPIAFDAEIALGRAVEAARPVAPFAARVETVPHAQARLAADRADLAAALAGAGVPQDAAATVVSGYLALRSQAPAADAGVPTLWTTLQRFFGVGTRATSAAVPAEFTLYLAGVRALESDPQAALALWKTLLELPPAERRYRTTWALFMSGNASDDDDTAGDFYRKVREAAAGGFVDSLGLAAATYRRDADRAGSEAPAKRFVALARAAAAGYAVPWPELRSLAWRALQDEADGAAQLLASPDIAPILNAMVLGSSKLFDTYDARLAARWYTSLAKAASAPWAGADQLAFGSYQVGRLGEARAWLAKADPKSSFSLWVASRFAARDGDPAGAAALAKAALRQSLTDAGLAPFQAAANPGQAYRVRETRHLAAQSGVDALTAGLVADALDLFLASGNWLDAAFLAERVISADELKIYVQTRLPHDDAALNAAAGESYEELPPERIPARLTYVLARRLLREGRGAEALAYLPTHEAAAGAAAQAGAPGPGRAALDLRADAARYVAATARAARVRGPAGAEALFEAAQIHRSRGLELFGTETAPDWAIFAGNFTLPNVYAARCGDQPAQTPVASTYERQRLAEHKLTYERRFHYRYVAADEAATAAKAAALDPKRACAMLGTAGRWLKHRDPDAAQRYLDLANASCLKPKAGGRGAFYAAWDGVSL